jgi:hypothetical protein
MMIDDQTILLGQMLEELKQQNQYLFDIRKRLESLESTLGRDQTNIGGAKESTQVRGT